jgi:CHAT domain-containing protein/Flp pilus assembly protein TadD
MNKQSYDTALVYAGKALQTVKEQVGENDTNYANMLGMMSAINYYSGNIAKAIEYCEKENEIRKKVQGENHPDYANSLGNLAVFYLAAGKYLLAERMFLNSIRIRKEVLGEKSPYYASSLNELGRLYIDMGNYAAAEPLLLEALKIRKEVLGEKNPEYASTLYNLGYLYFNMGNYQAAEPLYIEAMKIRKEVLGEKDAQYLGSLISLGAFYTEMGNYYAAEPLYIQAMNTQKEILGVKNPYYALSVNNLGLLYYYMDKFAAAEPLLIEAKGIYKETLGPRHPSYATSLNNLAFLYSLMGNYSVAEPYLLEAMNIYKEILGLKHPLYAMSLINLAELYHKMDNYPAADSLFLLAMNVSKESLGEYHSMYFTSLWDLAEVYEATGNYPAADSLYLEGLKIINANIRQNFSFLSEKEKENYIRILYGKFNSFSAFAFKYYRDNPAIAQNLYNLILSTKGLLLYTSIRIRDDIAGSGDTVLFNQYKGWQKLKEDIGRYHQWSKARLKNMNIKLDSVENLANGMEKQISLKSNAFSNDRKNQEITWDQVRQKLGDQDAAVEFITYQVTLSKNKLKKSDPAFYGALVLRKEDHYPHMIRLCTGNELSALLENKEPVQTTSKVKGIMPVIITYIADETESQELYRLLWHPLDSLLAGKKKIYVSLSGLLNIVSFNALRDDHEQLLLDKYNLFFVNSTRQLAMEEPAKSESGHSITLFGGMNYSLNTDSTCENIWNDLPGTLTEVNNIHKLFAGKKWNIEIYTGNEATEEAFKSLKGKDSPIILHISTHGFFFAEPDSTTFRRTQNQFMTMPNPLWRSGILFAGANYTWQFNHSFAGGEDGVLTAYEVANTNLKNTDLVVLSACETGLGDIKTGEGVYGLQRAFQVAGAKAVIMSLWQVPDKETTELMTLFYKSYIKTNNMHDAFRKAQITMSKKYAPFSWAAFVLME